MMSPLVQFAGIKRGFQNPVQQTQRCFRSMLDAVSRPGSITTLPSPSEHPAGWTTGLTAAALTLFDNDTKIWLDASAKSDDAVAYLRFHCGCVIVDEPEQANFGVICSPTDGLNLNQFAIGDAQYPDRSATLFLLVEQLTGGAELQCNGPGLKVPTGISPIGLPPDFASQWIDNHALYPNGIDIFLICGDQALGLPRSISIKEA
jgi:alpha-D-ribose 1-methylphosphonate 5-triphosphate synthase subunit PhnH